MSPIGGVGINLAVQDAVAAANLLAEPLRKGRVSEHDVRKVQRRRQWPTRATQALQTSLQRYVITPVLSKQRTPRVPVVVQLLSRLSLLPRLAAHLIGVGFRPEHVSKAVR